VSSWRKLLGQIVQDQRPAGYRYEELANILRNLGFETPKKSGSSHKVWRRAFTSGDTKRTVVVVLVDSGRGTVKPIYVQHMVRILRENDLLPKEV
jgi:hypothetical protein